MTERAVSDQAGEQAEIRAELRAVARDLLGGSGAGVDWQQLAGADWLGLEVAADLGGAGATFAEVAVIAEEFGRAAARGPYLSAVVLSVGVLNALEPNEHRDRLLGEIAAGTCVPAAVLGSGDCPGTVCTGTGHMGTGRIGKGQAPPFRLEQAADGPLLHGAASFLPGVVEASPLLLIATGPDGRPVVVSADPGTRGLGRAGQPVLDATRSLGVVRAAGVLVRPDCIWPFAGDGQASLQRLADRAAVAVACDSLGLSEAMLAATVGYARVREQFGRPIGSFQAVKHACADMLVQIRIARELVTEAVARVADPGCPGDEVSVAASMAKSFAGEAAVGIAGKAMQLHGGIGYTWESGIHVYLKRAMLDRELFGSPAAHRRRLAARYA